MLVRRDVRGIRLELCNKFAPVHAMVRLPRSLVGSQGWETDEVSLLRMDGHPIVCVCVCARALGGGLLNCPYPPVGDKIYNGTLCGRPEWAGGQHGLMLWATSLRVQVCVWVWGAGGEMGG